MALPPEDWPARRASRAVRAGGHDWHVQVAGPAPGAATPTLLLLHGSGGAAHSWAPMLPALAEHARVVAPDLPGHGFTRTTRQPDGPGELTLPALAVALDALLDALARDGAAGAAPALVVGHSAGAALALRWVLARGARAPVPVLGFAPSLVPPPPGYLQWLAPLVNPVATSAPVAGFFARIAAPTGLVDGLLGSTGSRVPAAQRAAYRRLFTDPAHVRGAMRFMAAADLPALLAECPGLLAPATMVLGTRDRWVPPAALGRVLAERLPQARVESWDLGHLLHEEDPPRAARRVLQALAEAQAGVASGKPSEAGVRKDPECD